VAEARELADRGIVELCLIAQDTTRYGEDLDYGRHGLVRLVEDKTLRPARTLELGCGTGADAIYLSQHGFEMTAVLALRPASRAQYSPAPPAPTTTTSNSWITVSFPV